MVSVRYVACEPNLIISLNSQHYNYHAVDPNQSNSLTHQNFLFSTEFTPKFWIFYQYTANFNVTVHCLL